jgi:tetratricopeptide (TPR) repeat protein
MRPLNMVAFVMLFLLPPEVAPAAPGQPPSCVVGERAAVLEDFPTAETKLEECLTQLVQENSSAVWKIARIELMLSRAYFRDEKPAKAKRVLTDLISYGPDKAGEVEVSAARTIRACLELDDNHADQADADLKDVVYIWKNILATRDLETINRVTELELPGAFREHFSILEPIFVQALRLLQSNLGPECLIVQQLDLKLADFYLDGDHDGAVVLYQAITSSLGNLSVRAFSPSGPPVRLVPDNEHLAVGALAWNGLGLGALARNNPSEALADFGTALQLAESVAEPDKFALVRIMTNFGSALTRQSDFQAASAVLGKAAAICADLREDHPLHALVLSRLGQLYMAQGDFPKAGDCFSWALAIAEEPDHKFDWVGMEILTDLSAYYLKTFSLQLEPSSTSKLHFAEAASKRVLRTLNSGGTQGLAIANVHESLATIYLLEKRVDAFRESCRSALAALGQDKSAAADEHRIYLFAKLGEDAFESNNFAQAQAYFESEVRAYQEHPRLNHLTGFPQALLWLGISYFNTKEYTKADAVLKRAEKVIVEKLGSSRGHEKELQKLLCSIAAWQIKVLESIKKQSLDARADADPPTPCRGAMAL